MSKAKEELTKLIEEQPDDSSHEEIVRELAFHIMVERGLADSDAGRVISNDDMARRIRSWPNNLDHGSLALARGHFRIHCRG
jgi:predicted transcriptional regulator